ncbi:MAG: glucose-6-phosphate dehydrogenase [Victivallales bacterium]|nr:glucose-6-phosphate dehydrogenase [Victivallales bacterium]
MNQDIDIVIFGASGDLARRKIFPAFFSLFSRGLLPEGVRFYGFARSDLSQKDFHDKIMSFLTCRYSPQESCREKMDSFLSRCEYVRGEYAADTGYRYLLDRMAAARGGGVSADRLFYLALPPEMFSIVSKRLSENSLALPEEDARCSRVIVEKPFGRDRESSDELIGELKKYFTESQTYRIDHYLGKEIVQDILVFRFANIVFQPIWNARYIEKIEILWSEELGVEGRGGYFDEYGIIRDVVQNHLFQVLSLLLMEEPDSLEANDIIDKKVDALRHIKPLRLRDVVLGQYSAGAGKPGYIEDPTVPKDSLTPTFAFLKLKVASPRWHTMPVEITAGKAMNERKAEVRIIFRKPCGSLFCKTGKCQPSNALVIRIQPDEGFHFQIATKEPGTKMELKHKNLDLSYISAFPGKTMPDAYENLLLDSIRGDKTLFIRNDELEAAWDILTPLLNEIEKSRLKPRLYKFASEGPEVKRYSRKHKLCLNPPA